MINVFLEYKLTFDSTSGCMQLQISADSFVFSFVLADNCYFRTYHIDQDDFAKLYRIFQFIKEMVLLLKYQEWAACRQVDLP